MLDAKQTPSETRIDAPISDVVMRLHSIRFPRVEFISADGSARHDDGSYASTLFQQRWTVPIPIPLPRRTIILSLWEYNGYIQPGSNARETKMVLQAVHYPLPHLIFGGLIALAVGVVLLLLIITGNVQVMGFGLLPIAFLGLVYAFVRPQLQAIVANQVSRLEATARGRSQ